MSAPADTGKRYRPVEPTPAQQALLDEAFRRLQERSEEPQPPADEEA